MENIHKWPTLAGHGTTVTDCIVSAGMNPLLPITVIWGFHAPVRRATDPVWH